VSEPIVIRGYALVYDSGEPVRQGDKVRPPDHFIGGRNQRYVIQGGQPPSEQAPDGWVWTTTKQLAPAALRCRWQREPVDVVELRDAILAMVAERFEGRELTIETATNALAQASFDLKMAHLRAVAGET
jgi:hypothetical protein